MTRAELNNLLNKADVSDDEYITFATPLGAEFGGISDILVSANNAKIVVLCGSHSDKNWCAKPDSSIAEPKHYIHQNWCKWHDAPIIDGECQYVANQVIKTD